MRPNTLNYAVTACLACLLSSAPADHHPSEYEIKAAILYNLAKFVEWPVSALATSDELTICVLGKDPFGNLLEKVIGDRTIHGRNISIVRAKTIDDLQPCHVLFIASSEKERLGRTLAKLKTSHALLVSDIKNFASKGGTIGMVRIRSRIRFEVNRATAQSSGLHLSSKFLRIARIVKDI